MEHAVPINSRFENADIVFIGDENLILRILLFVCIIGGSKVLLTKYVQETTYPYKIAQFHLSFRNTSDEVPNNSLIYSLLFEQFVLLGL